MIFYFSGTGNSQLAAKQIAEITKDDIISINQQLRQRSIHQSRHHEAPSRQGAHSSFYSEKPLVFVAPTYAWRMPRVVSQWIRETGFEGNKDAYFVLTCGGSCGNGAVYAKRICAEKGLHFRGFAPVLMPENYIALYETPDERESRSIIDKAKPCIDGLAMQIRHRKPFAESPVSFGDKLRSGLVNTLFYPLVVHDKGFNVTDDCVSCGKCAQRCPLVNIEIINKKPVWKGDCTHCMACIGGCPVNAIEYKSKTKGRNRYYIMKEQNM